MQPMSPKAQRLELYRSPRWKLARRAFLKAHPYCAHCGKAANTVDHAAGHSGDWLSRFWDASRWVAMCHSCHSRKTLLVDARLDGSNTRRYRSGFLGARVASSDGEGGRLANPGRSGASAPMGSKHIPKPDSLIPLDSAQALAARLKARFDLDQSKGDQS